VELADGRWLATFDQWHAYDDPGPYQPRMLAFYSSDKGQSWGNMVVMAEGASEGKRHWHGKTIRLADGRLYTLFMSADVTNPDKGPVHLPLHYATADETGRQWSTPQPTTIPGQTNWPAELPDGRLCAIYTRRKSEQPGFMAVLSEDGGETWDATGWTRIGLNSADKYPRSHDTIAFGAPTLMTTLDGDLYASWWCTYASLTHIRWARLRC
jgi:hypothetical protein